MNVASWAAAAAAVLAVAVTAGIAIAKVIVFVVREITAHNERINFLQDRVDRLEPPASWKERPTEHEQT